MWKDLTMLQKSDLMKLYILNGITDLNLILKHYNKFLEGGDILALVNRTNANSKANFISRLKNPNRAYILDWENPDNIATHKMSWATDDSGNAIIYPNVQEIDGKLVDFTRPPYDKWTGFNSAVERGDTIMTSPNTADEYTKTYKKYYPKGNSFLEGGNVLLPVYYGGELPEIEVTPTRKGDNKSIYQKMSNSPAGLIWDAVNLGLYVAAPFTGGITAIPAAGMTALQGGFAIDDVIKHGANTNNIIDIASILPGLGFTQKTVSALAKPIMKSVGKTTKYVNKAVKYVPNGTIQLGKYKKALWQYMLEDPKYIPYGTVVYGEDFINQALNTLQVINDVKELLNNPINSEDSKAQGGPLFKPFSYSSIPSVRYRKGGNLPIFKNRYNNGDAYEESNECAYFTNHELNNQGYMLSGNAWTPRGYDMVFNGFEGLESPESYIELDYNKYARAAAANVYNNFHTNDTLDQNKVYAVNMFYNNSPNKEKAFTEGDEIKGTHTGYLTYENGNWYVTHNIHGTVHKDKFFGLLNPNGNVAVTAIYEPRANTLGNRVKTKLGFAEGGYLNYSIFR